MGEVGGNRKEEGRKMERNSSIASEGKGDLLKKQISLQPLHTHHKDDRGQQSKNTALS